MKKNQIQELKNKPKEEQKKMLEENKNKLRDLKFNLAAGKVKNVSEIHKIKKIIARLETFLNNTRERQSSMPSKLI